MITKELVKQWAGEWYDMSLGAAPCSEAEYIADKAAAYGAEQAKAAMQTDPDDSDINQIHDANYRLGLADVKLGAVAWRWQINNSESWWFTDDKVFAWQHKDYGHDVQPLCTAEQLQQDVAAERALYQAATEGHEVTMCRAMNAEQRVRELEAALRQAVEALEWYVKEDDVIESMDGNEFWVEGKRTAEAVIANAQEVLK